MKRLPLIVTVFAVVLLSASLAYWGLQLFKPQQRHWRRRRRWPMGSISMRPRAVRRPGHVAAASNYQLKGVVAAHGERQCRHHLGGWQAGRGAGGPRVAPGVIVKEVHAKYVVLSEGGVLKRIELASDAGASTTAGPSPLQPAPPPQQPQPPATAPPRRSQPRCQYPARSPRSRLRPTAIGPLC
jgi:general secretion pathway protein C